MRRELRLYYQKADNNFGDMLSPLIIEQVFGLKCVWSKPQSADLVALGSLLERIQKKKWRRLIMGRLDPLQVWGSGFIQDGGNENHRFLEVTAVRGRLTAERFRLAHGVTLGDPGLLVSQFMKPTKRRRGVVVVPHVADRGSPVIRAFVEKLDADVRVLDLSCDTMQLLNEISKSDLIISTAMHPLIVGNALGIPAVLGTTGTPLEGGGYKFKDYCSVFDITPNLYNLGSYSKKDSLGKLYEMSEQLWVPRARLDAVVSSLITAFPF